MKSRFRKIALTVGDVNGVGLEVVAKALSQIAPSKKKNRAVFFLFRHHSQAKLQPKYFRLIDKTWNRIELSSLTEALEFFNSDLALQDAPDNILIDLSLKPNPAEWVREAALACKEGSLTSLVTGPLSKKITQTLPSKPVGHTGIFRDLFPDLPLHMGFIGKDFNVLLATDHLALSDVESALFDDQFLTALNSGRKLKALLGDKRKIAVLGLNPHAGEKGIIGSAEARLFFRIPRDFDGPLVPDAAFLQKNWKKYSLFICLYHDQGLIPFKMHHGQDSGVHITVGLPFIRTSVDHGTAVDIFNKNVANPASMLEAIHLNLRIAGA